MTTGISEHYGFIHTQTGRTHPIPFIHSSAPFPTPFWLPIPSPLPCCFFPLCRASFPPFRHQKIPGTCNFGQLANQMLFFAHKMATNCETKEEEDYHQIAANQKLINHFKVKHIRPSSFFIHFAHCCHHSVGSVWPNDQEGQRPGPIHFSLAHIDARPQGLTQVEADMRNRRCPACSRIRASSPHSHGHIRQHLQNNAE